jgi:hypothetical protein
MEGYENGVLIRMFDLKRCGIPGGQKKTHYEELRHLYSLLNIIRIIKLRRR